jgi:hypothetical protein
MKSLIKLTLYLAYLLLLDPSDPLKFVYRYKAL